MSAASARGHTHDRRRAHARQVAALWLFGTFFLLMVLRVPVAFALGLACLPVLFIEPRLSPMVDLQHDVQGVQLVHPARGAVLPADGQPDERRRHHRPAGARCRERWSATFPARWRRSTCCCRCSSPASPGSSTADAASQGKIFIEAQVKEGYDLSFSIAITAVSAVLAVIIPPSILMVVWGGVLQVSIGALYLAGVIPGLLIGLAQMATVHVYAKMRNYPTYPRATFKEFFKAAAISIPALMTPFIIVGGILLGWFTATESAAVAVIYAAVLSIFFYREMDAQEAVARAARDRQAVGDRAVLRRHGVGVRLAARLLPDPEGAARERDVVGPGADRRRLLHRVRVPRRRLLPRCDPGDHHRRHDAAAAGGVGATCTRCRSRSSASSRSRSAW